MLELFFECHTYPTFLWRTLHRDLEALNQHINPLFGFPIYPSQIALRAHAPAIDFTTTFEQVKVLGIQKQSQFNLCFRVHSEQGFDRVTKLFRSCIDVSRLALRNQPLIAA